MGTYPSWKFDIYDLRLHAIEFRKTLDKLKRGLGSSRLRWYPYDSLGVFTIMDGILAPERRSLLELARGRPILDLGCGDGDVSFLFESLGCQVHAVDYSGANYNHMRGVQALKREMKSSVEIFDVNLDEQFSLPRSGYGLALCLGVLYHLKNPYYLLEKLAKSAHYCLLSTRIAAVSDLPVAYLVDDSETNKDATNFWIFTDAGLRRILKRTGWEICDYQAVGCEQDSDPSTRRGDQRVYCLLKSPLYDTQWAVVLQDGWHPMEVGHFRWTAQRFTVRLARTGPSTASALTFDFFLPKDHLRRLGRMTLCALVNGRELPPQVFGKHGECRYHQPLPPGAYSGGVAEIEFTLDKAAPPSPDDPRELGLVVSFAREGCAVADSNLPLALE